MTVRSVEECISIYTRGPSSVALSLLNDEEVILLAQSGKIAAYALERALGNTNEHFERAVRVRRALICKCIRVYTHRRDLTTEL